MAVIRGNSSGNMAEVTAANELKTALSLTPANIGGVRIFSENDPTANYLKSPETSSDFRLRVGLDTLLFQDSFNASAQNFAYYSYTTATTAATWAGAGTVNITGGTTNAHGAFIRTYRYFPIIGTAPLAADITFGHFTAATATNEVWLMGFGLPGAATTEPTDGVWLQLTTAGLIGVMRYNGSTTQTGVIKAFASIPVGELHKYTIVVGENEVEYWQDDILLASQTIPVGNGQPCLQQSLPLFVMKYNSGAVTSTTSFRVSDLNVSLMDLGTNKPW